MPRLPNGLSWLLPARDEARARRRLRRSRRRCGKRSGLPEDLETLERRSMLSAMGLDIQSIVVDGRTVEAVKDEYVLRMPQLNADTATSVIDYASRQPGVRKQWSIEPLGSGFYKLTAPGASLANVTAWAAARNVLFVQPNVVHRSAATPNDAFYPSPDNWAFGTISASKAWDTSVGSQGTIVAVLDTGIDYNHVDLVGNMHRNIGEVPGNGIDDDGNGYADDVFGFNAMANNGNPMDDNGHGTFSAGLIGAVGNNGIGLAGVNWSVGMLGVKVLDASGVGTSASIISGVNYVTKNKILGQSISTVNCGFARPALNNAENQAEYQAFQQLSATGVVIVCAAGNEANDNDINPRYPGNFGIPTLISVAATTQADALAPFSNFGANTVDLAAPGVSMVSTRASGSGADFAPRAGDPNYAIGSGTSFSSALVAGTAALLKAVIPSASAVQIRQSILDGADRIGGLAGRVATGARLNVSGAVDALNDTIYGPPTATFKAGQVTQFVEGNKRYSFADVRVVLDRPSNPGRTAAVFYQTMPGGTAFSGVDFVAQSGFVTFSGSQTERVIRLRIIGDRLPELNEQFNVQLVASRSRGVVVTTSTLGITIVDDDYTTTPTVTAPANVLEPRVSIVPKPKLDASGNPIRLQEGDVAEFLVALDRISDKTVTVSYRTNEPVIAPVDHARAGLDYVETTGTLTFKPGEFSKTITVRTLTDNLLEVVDPLTGKQLTDATGGPLPEVFSVLLYEPTNAVLGGANSIAQAQLYDRPPPVRQPPPADGNFTITVTFPTPTNLTAGQQAVFAQAAARWQQIIVGDLPDVFDPATGQTIDDVLIQATAEPIDGVGNILGSAGPTDFRPGAKGLPWKGGMTFDTADLAALEASGDLVNVIVHEMAHVLGFGTVWSQQGLVSGSGSGNPLFVGTNAIREYNALFGQTASGVPLESQGGPGTAEGHWSENVFGAELMTGWLNPGVANPISRVTVGQFQDLGYQVDYAKADAFAALRNLARGQQLAIRMPGTIPGLRSSAPGVGDSSPTSPSRTPVTRQQVTVQSPAPAAQPAAQPQKPVAVQPSTPTRQPVTAAQPAGSATGPTSESVAAGQLTASAPVSRTPVTRG